MPVTYSFVTLVGADVGDEFDCMQVGEVGMPGILLFDEVTASRGAPHFSIDGNNDLAIYSDDGVVSQLLFELPIGEKHTFETTFTPEGIPANLSNLDQYRFFIGTYDRQDNASGVLISKDGIALVAYFGAAALVLPGSQGLFEESTQYTLRLVVDGEENLMHLYVTETANLALTGHILRYSSAAPDSLAGALDSIRIEILGQSAKAITGKFSTFNVSCTTALIPNQRPIADAGADQTTNIGSAIVHDGRNSYDPEGETLTYDWKLKDAPEGSRFRSGGVGGFTLAGLDDDGFTDTFYAGTDAFSEANMPLLQPGDHLQVGGAWYEVSDTGWVLDPTTGRYDRGTGRAWDDSEITVVAETIPDDLTGETWAILHSDTYFNDREQGFTSAIPDKAGVYTVGLIVNDGELDSFEAESILNVASTSVALGCIPDVSWIWNYLSDFWNLLEDREVVETVWSGFAQACAAQLLTAWQIDYNKSLLDIQRVFQRRWLGYSTILDETDPDENIIRIIRGPIFSGDLSSGVNVNGLTLQLALDADSIQTVTFVGSDPMTASQIGEDINSELGFSHSPEPLARVESTVKSGASPLVGGAVFNAANTLTGESLLLSFNGDVKTVDFVGGDPISIDDVILRINAKVGSEVAYESTATGLKSEGGGYLSFKTPDGVIQLLEQGAADNVTWTDLGFAARIGDPEYLVLEYGTLLRIRPNGTANSLLGYSTTAYTNNDLAGGSGAALSAARLTAFEASDPPLLDFSEQGLGNTDLLVVDGEGYRVQKVALDSATGTIRRGLTLADALPDDSTNAWIVPSIVKSENLNFSNELVVTGDLVRFDVKNNSSGVVAEVLCEVVGVKNLRVGFDPQPLLEHYAGVPGDYTTEFLGIKRLTYIPVDDLVVEIPRLQAVIKNPSSKLDQNVDFFVEEVTVGSDTVNAIRFKDGTFTLLDPPSDTLWAETTYLDNRPTIEANFGRLVNFKLEDLESITDDLDYLSAVRGLWWSYFGGPAVSKVKTGVQILLGLPFSEMPGVIQDIEPNFSAVEGRITIQDSANTDIIRTYYYPLDAGLAVNDATGEILSEGDSIAQFHPLSGGVEVLDWVNSPQWMAAYVSQGHYLEIEKYFKWLIRADVDTFNLANLIFAIDFAKKITPHYTENMFVLLKNMSASEVDISDAIDFSVTLSLFDTSCPDEPESFMWDATDESGDWVNTYDYAGTPKPFYDSHRICPEESVWVYISFTHAGGTPWAFDTIWTYDDGGGAEYLPLSGPAPTPPPPPYGPLVGVIEYDTVVTAGVYTRGITIA